MGLSCTFAREVRVLGLATAHKVDLFKSHAMKYCTTFARAPNERTQADRADVMVTTLLSLLESILSRMLVVSFDRLPTLSVDTSFIPNRLTLFGSFLIAGVFLGL